MRPTVRVAAGVLQRADGRWLATQRPAGKIAAGKWEFPGGKIEPGESPEQALCRELAEELGITVRPQGYSPLIRIAHSYSDRDVQMWVYRVQDWQGEPAGHDGQALCWADLAQLRVLDLLGADGPILRALALPRALPITPAKADLPALKRLARAWQAAGWPLARLRLPALGDAEYHRLAAALIAAPGPGWILDRDPEQTQALGAAGFHLRGAALAQCRERPVPATLWLSAATHDAPSWVTARALGCDFALLGPVRETPTHPGRAGIGWAAFADIVAQGGLPTYALGGLDLGAEAQARAHWGQGIAGIRWALPD